MCAGASEDALDLIRKILVFNPAERLSARSGLSHPYVAEYRGERDALQPDLNWHSLHIPVQVEIDDDTKIAVATYRDTLFAVYSSIKWPLCQCVYTKNRCVSRVNLAEMSGHILCK